MSGQRVGGDAAGAVRLAGGVLGVIVDVLGHGEDTYALGVRLLEDACASGSTDVKGTLTALHERHRGSRGAAVGVCFLDEATGELRYAGVGNTVLRCFGETEMRLVSQAGVLGERMRTPALQTIQLAGGDTILMYSDGVSSHFHASDYPNLRTEAPEQVAESVVRRFGKSHDDASCLVLRYTQ
ncbi:MAG: SpoIIE family protein phosphatase [Planctomycetota bacterium]